MSKKLNVNEITNELSEGSAFFRPYKSQPPKVAETPVPQEIKNPEIGTLKEQKNQRQQPDGSMSERANARTPVRPQGKRIITRNSFETFEDQMESLRRLSFEDKMEGKLGSMSAMVREAIDDYLQKRELQKKSLWKINQNIRTIVRPFYRSPERSVVRSNARTTERRNDASNGTIQTLSSLLIWLYIGSYINPYRNE